MGYDQVFNALQTGVVDGAENNPPSFVFDNHYQVAKYYTLDRASDRAGDAGVLQEDLGHVVEGRPGAGGEVRARKPSRKSASCGTKYEQQAMDKAKAAGIQIIAVADKKPWQDAVKPVWDKYGPKYAAMIKRIQEVK